MPTGYPSLTKNQKQEIEATTVLLVVLTQRRFYWSCLRNDGTGFIGRAYATTGFIGRAYATTGRDF